MAPQTFSWSFTVSAVVLAGTYFSLIRFQAFQKGAKSTPDGLPSVVLSIPTTVVERLCSPALMPRLNALMAIITPSMRRAACRLKNSISRIVSYNTYVAIKLHNTLSGKVEEFQPIKPNEVKMFVCGPTVYDYSHLGHAKTYTQFDFIARSFRYMGYQLKYLEDMIALGNKSVDKYARAHDYIPQIVDQVKRLVAKGIAYKISDGYYFDIKQFKDYGKLSGRSFLKPGDAVSRIDENQEKKNPGDFCLWKFKKDNDP